ncbi:unnamed protein product [Lathyrus sativus]|nr:unnamed protein product [Lathyrus sativus]
MVSLYTDLFNSSSILQPNGIFKEMIPNLVSTNINVMLTRTPSSEEIHHVIFAMNLNRAPRPDGFGASFFHKFWDIIKDDLVRVLFELFTSN